MTKITKCFNYGNLHVHRCLKSFGKGHSMSTALASQLVKKNFAHANSMCAHWVITIQNLSRMSDFDDYPFSLPQNWGKRMDFLKIFFTSEDKIFETTSCKVFITIKWLQWERFSFKVNWWVSC